MIEPTRARAPAGLRWIAILVAVVFGCTTVRAPASAIGDTIPVMDGRPEPQLELWIESARTISPAESARAAAQARAALASSVAARQAPDGDALLVVRAQGVVRTGSRKSSQGAAIAGLVVGAVVVVVVAVVMLVAGDGHGTRGKGGAKAPAPSRGTRVAPPRGAAAGAGAAIAAAGRPSPGPPAGGITAAAPGRPAPRPLPPLAPAPRPAGTIRPAPGPWLGPGLVSRADSGPYIWFDVWYGFSVDVTPGAEWTEAPGAATYEPFYEPFPPVGGPGPPPWQPWPPAGEGAPATTARTDVASLVLPPPPELRVAERDFFAGDETVLELVWVDRHTGAPLRAKTVRAGADPRDARAVGELLDRALRDESGWEPFDVPAAAAEPAGTSE